MARADSRWPLNAEARVRALINPFGISSGQSGTRTSFSPSYSLLLLIKLHHGFIFTYLLGDEYLRHVTVCINKKYAVHPYILNKTHNNHINKSKDTRATHCRKQELVKRSATQECIQILLSVKCEASTTNRPKT
jgi:hypothetical protein